MKAKIRNDSKAMQGVWTDDGLVMIDAGRTRTLTVADGYAERVKALPFLHVTEIDPLDHDGDGRKGGVADPAPLTEAEQIELLDAFTDAELRDFIAKRSGKAPHPNAKRETLLAKARGEG